MFVRHWLADCCDVVPLLLLNFQIISQSKGDTSKLTVLASAFRFSNYHIQQTNHASDVEYNFGLNGAELNSNFYDSNINNLLQFLLMLSVKILQRREIPFFAYYDYLYYDHNNNIMPTSCTHFNRTSAYSPFHYVPFRFVFVCCRLGRGRCSAD